VDTFSDKQDCRAVKSKDQGVDQLLFKISEIGTTEVVQSGKSSPYEMGSQQVSEIQATPLVHCLQVLERYLKGLPEFV
jgi:hypothetical protein